MSDIAGARRGAPISWRRRRVALVVAPIGACLVAGTMLAPTADAAASTLAAAAQQSGRYFGTAMTTQDINDSTQDATVRREFDMIWTCV